MFRQCHASTITRVPCGNFIRAVEIYGSLLTNSVNPPTVSFIHNVIRDGNYTPGRKIIYSLREKSITARRNFSRLDLHGYYSSGYDLLIEPRKLNCVLGKSLVWSASKISTCGHNELRPWIIAFTYIAILSPGIISQLIEREEKARAAVLRMIHSGA